MPDFLSLISLFQEDSLTIRARIDDDANAGLDPSDEASIDTREPGFYFDVTQPLVYEFARLWDALGTEVPAAASPAMAWGDYLDNWAAVFALERKVAVAAEGEAIFTGAQGVVIGEGTQVAPMPASPTDDPPVFQTTATGTTSQGILPPAGVSVTASEPGNLPAGAYYYNVTALSAVGETLPGDEISLVVLSSPGAVALSWSAVADAVGYRIYRGLEPGYESKLSIPALESDAAATGYRDDGSAALTTTLAPDQDSSAGVALAIRAITEDSLSNLATGAITQILTPIAGIDSVSNPGPTFGGTDPEDDESLRVRVLASFAGQGSGTVADYQNWALSYPGVGLAYVTPLWNGPGTVKVSVMAARNSPASIDTVAGLQAQLDPVPGQGAGQAPIGAHVTVTTPAVTPITIQAGLSYAPGYSADGDSGSTALRQPIADAIAAYLDTLGVGGTVVRDHVFAQFFTVEGVLDVVSGPLLNGAGADIALDTDHIAILGTPLTLDGSTGP